MPQMSPISWVWIVFFVIFGYIFFFTLFYYFFVSSFCFFCFSSVSYNYSWMW